MSQGIKLPEKVKLELLEDYRQGMPHKEVAAKYGISQASVTNYVKEAGIGRKNWWSEEDITYALDAYSKGSTIQEIATHLRRSRLDVSKKLRRKGLSIQHGSVRTQRVKGNPFQNLTNPNVQYWLGWLASDGCVTEKGQVILTCCKDPHMLEAYVAFLDCGLRVLTSPQAGREGLKHYVEFSNQEVAAYLHSLGIKPRKSLDLCMNIPLTWDFVRGYFDGNGTLIQRVKAATLVWYTASPLFRDQLLTFFHEKGVTTSCYTPKLSNHTYKPVYRVVIRKATEALLREMYPADCLYLQRKRPSIIKPNTEDIV